MPAARTVRWGRLCRRRPTSWGGGRLCASSLPGGEDGHRHRLLRREKFERCARHARTLHGPGAESQTVCGKTTIISGDASRQSREPARQSQEAAIRCRYIRPNECQIFRCRPPGEDCSRRTRCYPRAMPVACPVIMTSFLVLGTPARVLHRINGHIPRQFRDRHLDLLRVVLGLRFCGCDSLGAKLGCHESARVGLGYLTLLFPSLRGEPSASACQKPALRQTHTCPPRQADQPGAAHRTWIEFPQFPAGRAAVGYHRMPLSPVEPSKSQNVGSGLSS